MTTDHVLLTTDTIQSMLSDIADTTPCPDCAGGLGVHVEFNGDWTVVRLHDVPCPATAPDLRALS